VHIDSAHRDAKRCAISLARIAGCDEREHLFLATVRRAAPLARPICRRAASSERARHCCGRRNNARWRQPRSTAVIKSLPQFVFSTKPFAPERKTSRIRPPVTAAVEPGSASPARLHP
jgi:hypothetical protein